MQRDRHRSCVLIHLSINKLISSRLQSSDTLAANALLKKYYHEVRRVEMGGAFSEHSTVTSWGREREADAHRHAIETYFGGEQSARSRPGCSRGCPANSHSSAYQHKQKCTHAHTRSHMRTQHEEYLYLCLHLSISIYPSIRMYLYLSPSIYLYLYVWYTLICVYTSICQSIHIQKFKPWK